MLNRILLLTALCILALPIAGCQPDPAVKTGEMLDRRDPVLKPTVTQPENHPADGAAPQNPK